MYKQIFILTIALFLCGSIFAQTNDDSTGMIVHKSDRLDEMMKKQFTGSTLSTAARLVAEGKRVNYKVKRMGYRVLVLNTNDRELTYKTKGQLLGRYPDQQLYMVYQAPFFKLKMGDFVSKKDADKLRNELSKIVSGGVFLIHEMVLIKVSEDTQQ